MKEKKNAHATNSNLTIVAVAVVAVVVVSAVSAVYAAVVDVARVCLAHAVDVEPNDWK